MSDGSQSKKREKGTGKAKETKSIRVMVGDSDWNEADVNFELVESQSKRQWGSRMRVLGWLLGLVGLLAITVAGRAVIVGDREMLAQVWDVVKSAIPLLVGWAIGTVGSNGGDSRPG